MKSQISFIALVLVAATAVLGFATVGPLRATPDAQITPVQVSESNTHGPASRVFCYNGITGEQGSHYRGWICEPEHKLTLTN